MVKKDVTQTPGWADTEATKSGPSYVHLLSVKQIVVYRCFQKIREISTLNCGDKGIARSKETVVFKGDSEPGTAEVCKNVGPLWPA